MERFPGYTLVRTEDCPEQHGTLTVLTHDVSGATVLLVENEVKQKLLRWCAHFKKVCNFFKITLDKYHFSAYNSTR